MHDSFNYLIGQTITGISLSLDKTLILIKTLESEFYFKARYDCCNTVWFEHINGIELLPSNVIGVEDRAWQLINSDDGVYLDKCSFLLKTPKGYIDLELRNASNGYYGGYIELLDSYDTQDLFSEDGPILINLLESI